MTKNEDESEDGATMKAHDWELKKIFYPRSLVQAHRLPKSLSKSSLKEVEIVARGLLDRQCT